MSEQARRAEQNAFELGQQHSRNEHYDNPYPPQSQYSDLYDQGFEIERETIFE
ncbi:hypothetical protein NO932_11605 [Pelagibacterium sp. 26DY04]|uniref:hypothetical protein n=1 Tax=Pelagibacterium sp. 26DY04 TaxID=2967130 RepID=UPI002814EA02|nr:hypothetical protein [Pelagibacterium sp. 26DY04]WMT85573.1 hypothetical protein NO932_11605 [Pelagibacterium sp. 26DY04]